MSKIQQKQIQRRSEILDKVMQLTEKTPFVELSIRDICEGTGISVGSFYHYFKEKSDLVCGLMELIDGFMEEQVLPLLKRESAFEDLRIISRGFARHIANSGVEQTKLISVCKPTDVDDYGVRRSMFKLVESTILYGQESGEFQKELDPVEITEMLLTAISGVAIDWSRREASYDLLARMDAFTAVFFRALLN